MAKYYRHKIEKIIVIDDIVTIHYLEPEKDFSFGPEAHDFWELVYADKESLRLTADGNPVTLNEGEIIFHKPNESHSLAANGKNAPCVIVITFVCKSRAMKFFENKKFKLDKSLLKFAYAITEESKKSFVMPVFNPSMKRLEPIENPVLGGEQLIKNYLEIFLISIMRKETEKDRKSTEFLPNRALNGNLSRRVAEFLSENIERKVEIEEVCKVVNYNKSYVFRTFKKQTGTTVMGYFTELKIARAKQLLRENALNVREISEKLAFDTPNYFTKTFKKATGFSPTQYKKVYLSSSV